MNINIYQIAIMYYYNNILRTYYIVPIIGFVVTSSWVPQLMAL